MVTRSEISLAVRFGDANPGPDTERCKEVRLIENYLCVDGEIAGTRTSRKGRFFRLSPAGHGCRG